MYKVALIVPCYHRPQRTIRAIECVLNQDMNGWEAYFVGDNCPFIQSIVDNGKVHDYIGMAKNSGNKLSIFNLVHHYGGYGYQSRNTCIQLCSANYVMFMDNDDVIEKNHFSNYYNAISQTNNDLMYFNTLLEPIMDGGKRGKLRDAKLEEGMVGHSEIIVRSEFLKRMNPQIPEYNHDWVLIKQMIDAGAKCQKGYTEPTYKIMGVGELRETRID